MTYGHLILAATLAAPMFLTGCERNEGPAEKAGAKIDHAVDQAGEKIEDAGEKIQHEANP
jgi:hypothetical protein